MSDPIILDASPLSRLSHPNEQQPDVREIRAWMAGHLATGTVIIIAEIADYEVRRELTRLGKTRSVARLDGLQRTLRYLPIDTAMMRRAAELWAQARNQGTPTAAPEALDADVILAAQAESVGAVVATENVAHLSRFVAAEHWRNIPPVP